MSRSAGFTEQMIAPGSPPQVDELILLQAVRLKGRISPPDLAVTMRADAERVFGAVAELIDCNLLCAGKRLRLSESGRDRLNELLAQERSQIDVSSISDQYDQFRRVNADFKTAIAEWQIKDGNANAHDDAAYDRAVLSRINEIHNAVMPLIGAVAVLVPRMGGYGVKLAEALARVNSGDATWLTSPLIDSYHTVWFEMHEELMNLAGHTREAEAKAGYAG